MMDISSELAYLTKQNVPSFLAFLTLKGVINESVYESDASKSVYDKTQSVLSTTAKQRNTLGTRHRRSKSVAVKSK